jgi:hypothetical protein
MATITNSKTWTKIYRSVPSGTNTVKTFLRTLKNDLITAGFSHVASSDSISISTSTDLWDSDSDIVASVGDHSWIVLANSSISSGLQICIDLGTSDLSRIRLYLSENAYSGGSVSSKPTATNEVEVTVGETYWTPQSTSYSRQYNMFYSSDGQCVRVFFGYVGANAYGIFNVERIQNAPSWVSFPVVAHVTITNPVRSSLYSYGVCNFNGKRSPISYGGLVLSTYHIEDLAILNAGDYGSNWPCSPVIVLGYSNAIQGIFGQLADLWHGVDDLASFDYFPGDGSKAQVVMDDLIQGSDGSTISW